MVVVRVVSRSEFSEAVGQLRRLLIWLMERNSPGFERHGRLQEWVRQHLDVANRLIMLNQRQIDWWVLSGRHNPVVVRRVELREKHIDWILDRVGRMQAEQEEISKSW